MVYANIISPRKIIFGKFSIRISLACGVIGFSRDNITLVGDTDGIDYRISNVGCGYILHFTLPQNTDGQFTVSLTGYVQVENNPDPVQIEPVYAVIDYDTNKIVNAVFSEPVYQNGQITLPIIFPENIINLTKNHFAINFSVGKGKYLLYGADKDYQLVLRPPRSKYGRITVAFAQKITKATGISVTANISPLNLKYKQGGR